MGDGESSSERLCRLLADALPVFDPRECFHPQHVDCFSGCSIDGAFDCNMFDTDMLFGDSVLEDIGGA